MAEIASMLIQGKCHCGNISFSLAWEPEPAEIPACAGTCWIAGLKYIESGT